MSKQSNESKYITKSSFLSASFVCRHPLKSNLIRKIDWLCVFHLLINEFCWCFSVCSVEALFKWRVTKKKSTPFKTNFRMIAQKMCHLIDWNRATACTCYIIDEFSFHIKHFLNAMLVFSMYTHLNLFTHKIQFPIRYWITNANTDNGKIMRWKWWCSLL